MIRMNKFLEKAYGVSNVNRLKEVVFSHVELMEASEFIEIDISEDVSEFLDTFIEALSASNSLTSLRIIDKNLFFDVSVVLQHTSLSKLKEFSLVTIDDTFLSETKSQKLPRFISSLSSVETLEIAFNRTQFSTNVLSSLASSIGELKQLQELRLQIKSCSKINDHFIAQLCSSFKNLTELRKIVLDFTQGSISNQGLITLGETIAILSQLKHIQVILPRNACINAEGSGIYFEHLLRHKNCLSFDTKLIHPLEPPESNPNFTSIQNFNQKKTTIQSTTPKFKFSTATPRQLSFLKFILQNQKEIPKDIRLVSQRVNNVQVQKMKLISRIISSLKRI